MKRTVTTVSLLALMASPAFAYPTALVFIPTGDTLSAGKLHLGFYTGAPYDPVLRYGDFSLNAGVFDGFEVNGLRLGKLEMGFDAFDPSLGSIFTLSGKIGLLGETEFLPSIALGSYYTGFPNLTRTPNLTFLSMSKSLKIGDIDLGAWTLGTMRPSPTSNNDRSEYLLTAGMSHSLPLDGLGFAIDHMTGQSSYSATNFGVYYSPTPDLTLTLGYWRSNNRTTPNDFPMLFIDYTLPLAASK